MPAAKPDRVKSATQFLDLTLKLTTLILLVCVPVAMLWLDTRYAKAEDAIKHASKVEVQQVKAKVEPLAQQMRDLGRQLAEVACMLEGGHWRFDRCVVRSDSTVPEPAIDTAPPP